MTEHDFPIVGIPEEPGVYESRNFPLDEELTGGGHYLAYYKYPDGTFREGTRTQQMSIKELDAVILGPFRRVGDLPE